MGKESSDKVNEFKQFVRKHPGMIKEVRNGNKTWQNFFEEWSLLGEEDNHWNDYNGKETVSGKGNTNKKKRSSPNADQIFSMIKNIDLNQMQQYVSQFGGAMATAQELLQMFQSNQSSNSANQKQFRPEQSGQYDYHQPYFRD
jgi:hypothetical protein